MNTRQLADPTRAEITVLRRPRNPKGVLLVDDAVLEPLRQARIAAPDCPHARIGFGGVCLDCGKEGADQRKDFPTMEQVFDKLHRAGVEIVVNGVKS